MKRFVTALGMCAVLIAASQAYAAKSFYWNGRQSTAWDFCDFGGPNRDNWNNDQQCDWPGRMGVTTDVVFIDANPNDEQPEFNTRTTTVATITIDADDGGVEVWLTVSSGSLTTTGTVLVKGKQDALGDDYAATMAVTGGTFRPNNLYLDGGLAVDNEAVLEFYEDVTVQTSTGTSFAGYCDVMLDTGVTFAAQEVELDEGADVLVSATTTDGGTLQATKVTVNNATLRVTDATIQTAD